MATASAIAAFFNTKYFCFFHQHLWKAGPFEETNDKITYWNLGFVLTPQLITTNDRKCGTWTQTKIWLSNGCCKNAKEEVIRDDRWFPNVNVTANDPSAEMEFVTSSPFCSEDKKSRLHPGHFSIASWLQDNYNLI
jgi:hypothetical protein